MYRWLYVKILVYLYFNKKIIYFSKLLMDFFLVELFGDVVVVSEFIFFMVIMKEFDF